MSNTLCIIVYKPAGRSLPEKDVLRKCYLNNNDGAGYMYPLLDKKKVKIRKGFMAFEDFYNSVSSIPDLDSMPLVMHFRIGTQGANSKEMTHPFPITKDDEALTAQFSLANIALTHNGIIPMTSYSNARDKELKSDTFYFVRDYASLICDRIGWYKDKNKIKLLDTMAESKLCIMDGDGNVQMIGSFIHETDDECYYSNTGYMYSYYSSCGHQSKTTGLSIWNDNGYEVVDRWGYTAEDYGMTDEEWKRYEMGEFTMTEYMEAQERDGDNFSWGRVKAQFVSENLLIMSEQNNVLMDAREDMWVHDAHGNVYIYDSKENGLVFMGSYQVVDDDGNEVLADGLTSVMFDIVG